MSERTFDTSKMTDVLSSVGFKSTDVDSQTKVTNRLVKALANEGIARDQQRILCYLLSQMGLKAAQINTAINGLASVNTIKTRIMEGTVMVLTGQPVLADQVKFLDKSDIDSVKSLLSKPTIEENASRFIEKAVMDTVRNKYTKPDKSAFTPEEVEQYRDDAIAVLGNTAQAITPDNIVSLITNAEDTASLFVKKTQGPDNDGDNATAAPKTPKQHFEAALTDAKKIASDTPDEPMILTADDVLALFELVSFFANAEEVFSAASTPEPIGS